jgi:hypothetical protein
MDIVKEYHIINQFFLMEQPCPSEIQNCQSLRNNYITANANLKKQGGCYPCMHNNLRTNTIQAIKKNLVLENAT